MAKKLLFALLTALAVYTICLFMIDIKEKLTEESPQQIREHYRSVGY